MYQAVRDDVQARAIHKLADSVGIKRTVASGFRSTSPNKLTYGKSPLVTQSIWEAILPTPHRLLGVCQ